MYHYLYVCIDLAIITICTHFLNKIQYDTKCILIIVNDNLNRVIL